MFSHVVLFCVMLICKEPFGADEIKPSLVEQLNATLIFPGWKRINNVGAKYRKSVDGNESFTGKDLFVNLFFDNENSDYTLVDVDNESVKHYMVTHLVGCLYVNEMVKFMDLLRIILDEVAKVRRNLKTKANRRKIRKLDDAMDAKYAREATEKAGSVQIETPVQQSYEGSENNSDNQGDRLTDEEHTDFKEPWEIFNFALLQLTESSTMLDVMFSTMRYLIDTIPSGEPFDPYITELLDIQFIPCLRLFKDVSRNINLALPEYIGKTDPDYNDKVSLLPQKFIKFLNSQANTTMRPFLENFCTVSETARPNLKTEINLFKNTYGRQPTSLDIAYQIGNQIRQLVHKVCHNYHSQLGFLYDNHKQTTSYAIPPTL